MERTERLLFLWVLMVISLFVPSFNQKVIFTLGNYFTNGTYFTIGYMILTGLCVITVLQRFIYGSIQIIRSEAEIESVKDVQN